MALTKEAVQAIHADIRAALQEVAKKHNLAMANTHISYNDAGFKFTGEFGSKEVMGEVNPKHYKDMQRHGWRYKLDVADIGKKITYNKREFTIEGMTGYTFVAIRGEDGGAYKLKGDIVQKLLGRTAPVPNLISIPTPR